jgi:hypothetical protein
MIDRPNNEPLDPGIASFVAVVRLFEKKIWIFDEPAQYVRVLELGAKAVSEGRPVERQ